MKVYILILFFNIPTASYSQNTMPSIIDNLANPAQCDHFIRQMKSPQRLESWQCIEVWKAKP